MVHACQKYGKCPSKQVKDMADKIDPKNVEDFAKTKHDGLPERVESKKEGRYKTFGDYLAEFAPNAQVTAPGANARLSSRVRTNQGRLMNSLPDVEGSQANRLNLTLLLNFLVERKIDIKTLRRGMMIYANYLRKNGQQVPEEDAQQ